MQIRSFYKNHIFVVGIIFYLLIYHVVPLIERFIIFPTFHLSLFHGTMGCVVYSGIDIISLYFLIQQYSQRDSIFEIPKIKALATTDLSILQVFIKYIILNKIVWAIALTSMAIYIIRYGIMSWIPSYLPTKGFTPSFSKWLIGIFEIAAVPGVIIMGMLSDKLKGQRALVCLWCLFGLTASLLIYFFSDNQTFITIDLFFMGSLIYAPATLIGLMINEAVPKFAVGVSTGFIGFFQYVLGEVGATALIGVLVDKFGWQANSAVIFIALGVIFILTIYLVLNDRKVLKREMSLEKNKNLNE